MAYKMLAIDVDDTLLNRNLQITQRTVAAIEAAKKAGVRVVISSGRMYRAIVQYLEQLKLHEPAIVYNGALVIHPAMEKPLFHQPIPVEIARKVADWVEAAGSQLNVYINDWLYVREKTPEVLRYMERTGVDATVVGSIGEFLQVNPTKLLIMHFNLTEIEVMRTELMARFGECLEITSSKPYFIEIMAKGVSKGQALQNLALREGIKSTEVIAIGDGLNDKEMISWAGLGVAMGNGHPELLKVASHVTASSEEDGVAQVIEKFVLRRR